MKTSIDILNWISIGLAIFSGIFWIRAAQIATPLPISWLSGPPPEVVSAIKKQGTFNGIAAWFAAGTAFAQAISMLLIKFGN